MFLYRGQVLTIDTPQAIIEQHTVPIYAVRSDHMSRLLRDLRSFEDLDACYTFGDTHHVSSVRVPPDELQARLAALGHQQLQLQHIRPTIEDCFIHLMRTQTQ